MESNNPQFISLIDYTEQTDRHVVIAAGTGEIYQGHPTTVLLADGATMLCAWCINHGGHCGPLARSEDGGLTWTPFRSIGDFPCIMAFTTIMRLKNGDYLGLYPRG